MLVMPDAAKGKVTTKKWVKNYSPLSGSFTTFIGFNAAFLSDVPPGVISPSLVVVFPLFRFNVEKWREHTFITEPALISPIGAAPYCTYRYKNSLHGRPPNFLHCVLLFYSGWCNFALLLLFLQLLLGVSLPLDHMLNFRSLTST